MISTPLPIRMDTMLSGNVDLMVVCGFHGDCSVLALLVPT